jgi:hypothetical protein
MKHQTRLFNIFAVLALAAASTTFAADRSSHTSNGFAGPKANTGKVEHTYQGNQSILRVTEDFRVPDTPAPTWRIVDSKGTVYTLDAFKIKGGEKRQVNVPQFVRDIAKVQVYCAWAEVLLGEASFTSPVH